MGRGLLVATDVLVLLPTDNGPARAARGNDVDLSPLELIDVAPAHDLGLAGEARHREGAAVDDAGGEHHVEQGAHRLDAILLGGPGAARLDEFRELLVRVLELVEVIHGLDPDVCPGLFEGRVRGEGAPSAQVCVLEVLREQARGLKLLPGALEPGVVELGRLP